MDIDKMSNQELQAYRAHLRDYLRDINAAQMRIQGRLASVEQKMFNPGGVHESTKED